MTADAVRFGPATHSDMSNSTQIDNAFDSFAVGDPVHWSAGTDVEPGTVVRLTATRVIVRAVKATLLNGVNSGEPDALRFYPGGFVGHTSGRQRYEFGELEGPEIVFSRRAIVAGKQWCSEARAYVGGYETAIAKMMGTSMRGSMSSWGRLHHGHQKHYDYNF